MLKQRRSEECTHLLDVSGPLVAHPPPGRLDSVKGGDVRRSRSTGAQGRQLRDPYLQWWGVKREAVCTYI